MCVSVMRNRGYAYQHGFFVNDLAHVHSEDTCMQLCICSILSTFLYLCVPHQTLCVKGRGILK